MVKAHDTMALTHLPIRAYLRNDWLIFFNLPVSSCFYFILAWKLMARPLGLRRSNSSLLTLKVFPFFAQFNLLPSYPLKSLEHTHIRNRYSRCSHCRMPRLRTGKGGWPVWLAGQSWSTVRRDRCHSALQEKSDPKIKGKLVRQQTNSMWSSHSVILLPVDVNN